MSSNLPSRKQGIDEVEIKRQVNIVKSRKGNEAKLQFKAYKDQEEAWAKMTEREKDGTNTNKIKKVYLGKKTISGGAVVSCM